MPRRKIQSFSYKTEASIEQKSVKPIVYFILLFLTIFAVFNMRYATDAKQVLPFATLSNDPKTAPELSLAIRKKLQDEQGIYSIRYEDFNSKNAFGINDEMVVTAASVIKIPVLAALYQLAEKKEVNLDEQITIPEADMQRWGTGVIRYENAGVTYTIRELAELMIEKSDNTAVYVLANRVIGLKRVQEMISSWGLSHTNYSENKTSNKDMNKLMRAMYLGEVVHDTALNDEMIGFMDDSDFEERLPKLLPDYIDVYHKIGNEVRITHDVGIIDLQGKPYFLGILGTDISDYERAAQVIAEISEMVFKYQNETQE
jgi:beta-lactamase class A